MLARAASPEEPGSGASAHGGPGLVFQLSSGTGPVAGIDCHYLVLLV